MAYIISVVQTEFQCICEARVQTHYVVIADVATTQMKGHDEDALQRQVFPLDFYLLFQFFSCLVGDGCILTDLL